MKKLTTLVFVVFCLTIKAQEKPILVKSNFNSLKFSVDNVEELETINWNDVKEVFSEDKCSNKISLAFELKKDKETKTSYNVKIVGEVNDIEELISKSKKAINTLKRLKS